MAAIARRRRTVRMMRTPSGIAPSISTAATYPSNGAATTPTATPTPNSTAPAASIQKSISRMAFAVRTSKKRQLPVINSPSSIAGDRLDQRDEGQKEPEDHHPDHHRDEQDQHG